MKTLAVAMMCVMLAAVPVSAGARDAPLAQEKGDDLVLANGIVTVTFEGNRPHLRVQATSDPSSAYTLRFDRLVEFSDADGDRVADTDEIRAVFGFHSIRTWTAERAADDGFAEIRLNLVGPVSLRGPAATDVEPPVGPFDANVTLVFRVFEGARTVEGANASLPIAPAAIHYRLVVASWPWIDAASDRLALFATASSTLDAAGERAVIIRNGTKALGGAAWLGEAEVSKDDAEAVAEVVTNITSVDGNSTLQHAFDALGFETLGFDGALSVVTPPTVEETDGILPGSLRESPAPWTALALAGVGAAAVVARRRT